ncbi:MAG: immunoglobulin domain-containing protein [Phycisphaeraceae bacterium]|nr:immunoglobulin domain-containing protein [Phycisphaeraceae bacterium]
MRSFERLAARWVVIALVVYVMSSTAGRVAHAQPCPTAPTPTASTTNCGGVVVSWTQNPQASSYDVIRMGPDGTIVIAMFVSGPTYLDATAQIGFTYKYQLAARRTSTLECPLGIGSPGAFSNDGFRAGTPGQPALSVLSTTCLIQLMVQSGAHTNSVTVLRSTSPLFTDPTVVGTVGLGSNVSTPMFDLNIQMGVTYYYRAVATGVCGDGPVSATVSTTPTAVVLTEVPLVEAEAGSECGTIRFSWSPVAGATQYFWAVLLFSEIESSGSTTGTELVYTPPDGGPRRLRVVGAGTCGNSPLGQSVLVSASVPPGAVVAGAPESVSVDSGGTAVLSAELTNLPSAQWVRWEKDGVPLNDSWRVQGTSTGELTIQHATVQDAGDYRLVVQTGCGQGASTKAVLAVRPSCAGDYDGSGTIDLADLLAFLQPWLSGLGQNCP